MGSRRRSSVRNQLLGPEREEPEEVQPYAVCGRFKVDWAGLCEELGLAFVPEVVARPCPPYLMEQAQKKAKVEAEAAAKSADRSKRGGKWNRKDQKEKDKAPMETPVHASQPFLTADKQPHATFLVKENKFEYFAPCIQVQQEQADDDRTVTEIHIRGWKVDLVMMEVFQKCWPVMPMLHTVHLWNVGLAADTLPLLASFLPLCQHLHTLVLDSNALSHLQVSDLLREDCRLEHLSLRFCGLTDTCVQGLADALGSVAAGNATLQTLNLANNRIGDVGLTALAAALFINRSLLVLNLAANEVGDEGAVRLAEVLSWFPVTGERLSARRLLIRRELRASIETPSYETSSPDPAGSFCDGQAKKKDRSGSRASVSKGRLGEKVDKDRQRKVSSHKKTSKKKATSKLVLPVKERLYSGPEFRYSRDNSIHRPERFPEDDVKVSPCGSHPLLQGGYLHDGDLWLPGNRTLVSVNLSRNQVGERGLRALLQAVEELPPMLDDAEPGLLRLVLHRNAFPPDSRLAQRLQHRMTLRDPMFRSARIDLQKPSVSPCALPANLVF